MWEVAWENLNLLSCKQKKIIQFQWKCIHGKHTEQITENGEIKLTMPFLKK